MVTATPSVGVQRKEPAEGLKGRLVSPHTTVDDTIEHVVRGHVPQLAAVAVLMAAPSSPRVQSPRGPQHGPLPAPAVMKVELPQQMKETLVDPAPKKPVPSATVVVNLRSGPPIKVPPPPAVTSSSVVHAVQLVSSSVSIIPTQTTSAPSSGPPVPSAASEVARLPSATVVTPVPSRPVSSSGPYPAVPLTRDSPQAVQQPAAQQAGPAAVGQPSVAQQPSGAGALQLPAGVPVSLSGGATVIAVASGGRVSGASVVARQPVGELVSGEIDPCKLTSLAFSLEQCR